MKFSLALIFTVLMAGWATAQDTTINVTDSSSSTGIELVDNSAYTQFKNLMIQALSINGAIAFVIILILIIGLVYLYKRNKAKDEAYARQNRRASAALDSTTTPAAAGSNAVDLHAVVVGTAEDTKDKEETTADVAASVPKVPASPKTVVAGRRGSGSQTRPPAVSTAGKSAGAQPPSPAPQVVKVRRPSLKGNAAAGAAAAAAGATASPVVSAKSRSRSNTPNRHGTA